MDNRAFNNTVYNIPSRDEDYRSRDADYRDRNGDYKDRDVDYNVVVPHGTKGSMDTESIAADYNDDGLEKFRYFDDLDPRMFDFNGSTNVSFEKVFFEPEFYSENSCGGYLHSFIRNYMGKVYSYVQMGVYYGLVIFLGFFLSALWGLIFGLVHFILVWFTQPMMKWFFVYLRVSGVFFRASIRTAMDPIFQSFGMVASQMRGRFHLNLTGLEKVRVNRIIDA